MAQWDYFDDDDVCNAPTYTTPITPSPLRKQ